MSRTVEYTAGKKWRGRVTFREPLFYEDCLAIEECQERVDEILGPEPKKARLSQRTRSHKTWLPILLPFVERFELEDFPESVTAATFPGSPRLESSKLVSFLLDTVIAIYLGEQEQIDPNGSGPPRTERRPEPEPAAN